MARILSTKNSLNSQRPVDSIRHNRVNEIEQKQSPFEIQLKISHVKSELDQLLVDIDKQGKELIKSMNLKDLKKYRELISTYIKKATGEMYNLKIQNGDYYNPHKEYVTIEKIDEELDKITKNLLSDESDNLFILDRINYIKGMLLNIAI